jgi:ABC-2 type transport system ATP-binding protein
MTAPALRVRDVWKRFGARDALAGVSLEAPRGSCFAMLGHNGSGKTTLLRILATLSAPTEGEAEVLGHVVGKESHDIRGKIGVVLDRHRPRPAPAAARLPAARRVAHVRRPLRRA